MAWCRPRRTDCRSTSKYALQRAYYFSIDHDLRATARDIDTSRVAAYLLTGEYDWAATPVMSRELAEQIPGASYRTMEGLGHFPMSEALSEKLMLAAAIELIARPG
ncbi:MAG: hypothetical protein E6J83_16265 [Deltaproteobacteria bacterium]|nr:MAG: hypothetical protein E6J83_16265 [Deltaproteobacteria bacterium]